MQVFLSLGGNKEQTLKAFSNAILALKKQVGKVLKTSTIYYTEAWGFKKETNPFYNQVVEIETNLSPLNLLLATQKIENALGREPKTKVEYESRIIDIDILFYDDLIIKKPKLTVPHYLIHKRNFILVPFAEIYPNFIHPNFQKTIKELLLQCKDNLFVKKLD